MKNQILKPILAIIIVIMCSGFTISSSNELPSFYTKQTVTTIKWNTCKEDPTFQCGFLSVPINYNNLKSGFLNLPVSLHKATKKKLGYLFFNFGGPWTNNVAVLHFITKTRLSKLVQEHFDLVTFNPRGASPNIILCRSKNMKRIQIIDQNLKKMILNSTININEPLIYQFTNEKQNLCHYNSLYKFMSTKNTIRDMDQLRKVLQIDKINFYGVSYGSRLGLAYLLQYPNHVNKMILDGNLLPNNNFKEFVTMRAKGAYETYQSFFNYCVKAKNNCPYYNNNSRSTLQMMEEGYNKLLHKSERYGIHTSGKYYNQPLSAGMLANLISTEMDASKWPELASGLKQAAAENNADQLMELYMDQTGYDPKLNSYKIDYGSATRSAVLCKDYKVTEDLKEEKSWLEFVNTIKNNYSLVGSTASAWLSPVCINWPAQSEPLLPQKPYPIKSKLPIVFLIGNAEDPMMPFENNKKLETYLNNLNIKTHILKWNAFGHTALLTTSSLSTCVFKTVDNFLLTDNILPEQSECSDWKNPFKKETF